MKNSNQKLNTFWLANTDPYISVHTSMCYTTSMTNASWRYLVKFYLRVGRLVVSITPCQGISAHRTLRNTLTAVCLCHDYLATMPCVRSRIILKASVKSFISLRKKRYMRLPLNHLMLLAVKCLVRTSLPMLGGRLSLYSSRNVEDLTIQTITNVLTLISSYEPLAVSTASRT